MRHGTLPLSNHGHSERNRPGLARRTLLAAPLALGLGAPALLRSARQARAGEETLPAPVLASLPRAMREAVAEARQAVYAFGAVLLDVETGATVFRAHNTTTDGDPSAHAEVNVIRGAGLSGLDLRRTVLVTSAESCPMCAACAVWAGLAGVAYGTSIESLIRFGWKQIAIPQREVVARADFNRMPIVGPLFTEETDPLYAAGPPR